MKIKVGLHCIAEIRQFKDLDRIGDIFYNRFLCLQLEYTTIRKHISSGIIKDPLNMKYKTFK